MPGISATYISTTEFSVGGDWSDEFSPQRRVQVDLGSYGFEYSSVQSSSYNGTVTQVVLYDGVLNSHLETAWFGVVGVGDEQALPMRILSGAVTTRIGQDVNENDLHVEIEVSSQRDFSDPVISVFSGDDQTGWYYDAGGAFLIVPESGVPYGSSPCSVAYEWDAGEIIRWRRYYVRWRTYNGTSYSDWVAGVMIW